LHTLSYSTPWRVLYIPTQLIFLNLFVLIISDVEYSWRISSFVSFLQAFVPSYLSVTNILLRFSFSSSSAGVPNISSILSAYYIFDARRKTIIQTDFRYWGEKQTYCIFVGRQWYKLILGIEERSKLIAFLFPTECHSFYNFAFFFSNNVHLSHTESANI